MTLGTLASSSDLSARGIPITDTPGVAAALDVASQAIRDAAGNCISEQTSTVTTWAPPGNFLTLPGPITAVASVVIDGGPPLTQDQDFYVLPNGLWAAGGWDPAVNAGIDPLAGFSSLPGGGPTHARPIPVVVTFTHGLAAVPSDIVDLTCALAAMWLTAKSVAFAMLPGTSSWKQDDAAETLTAEAAGRVSPVWLPKETKAWLSSRFGGGAYVVELGP